MSLLVELPQNSGGRVRSFYQPASSLPWLSTLTGGRSSEISHPINKINQVEFSGVPYGTCNLFIIL
jgi:hypothetical protein